MDSEHTRHESGHDGGELPKDTPTKSRTPPSPPLAPQARSSPAIPAKQEAIALMGFLAISFIHSFNNCVDQ